ncbi:hypothetical protein HYU15_02240 [Candidatus Woesearchaeota archaeon]|nr:hypothetical protein [Candidatus Woesearchaeota archaeon]
MALETVTIPKAEYERLKKMAEVDWELVEKLKKSFEDIKYGRITEVKPARAK